MISPEIKQYYDATADRAIRDDLKFAVSLVVDPGVATDCGCGAGADIAFLLTNHFTVHAFDVEPESIARCRERFGDNSRVTLYQDSFSSFAFPKAALVNADASLFFCPAAEFDAVWRRLVDSLLPGGVFSGSFLGPKDTMAGPDYDRDAFWPDVLTLDEDQVRARFKELEILKWTEHDQSGHTPQGVPHHWHIFSVVARKPR